MVSPMTTDDDVKVTEDPSVSDETASDTPLVDAVLAHVPGVSRELQEEAKKAEERAAAIMQRIGYKDAQRTKTGPDRGIDVEASGAVAQVKWYSKPVSRDATQQMAGAWLQRQSRFKKNEKMFFFAKSGYSKYAVKYADDIGMALFQFTANGKAAAANKHAQAYQKDYPRTISKSIKPSTAPTTSRWSNLLEGLLVFLIVFVLPLAMIAAGGYLGYLGIDNIASGGSAVAGFGFIVGGIILWAILALTVWWLVWKES